MIQLGNYNTLIIDRVTSVGFYLKAIDGDADNAILLPNKYKTAEMEIGSEVEVFVYADSQDRMVATTERPYACKNEIAGMDVASVNTIGAFLDWGLEEKELLLPFKNQAHRVKPGDRVLVYVYEDEDTHRMVASTRLSKFLSKTVAPDNYEINDEVDLIVIGHSELGMNVVIDQRYEGLIYQNEVIGKWETGDILNGYIKCIREDGKIDISQQPIGVKSIEPNAQKIMELLEENGGFLNLHDGSDPALIRSKVGISKKLFKKAVGTLFKNKIIFIEENGIRLIPSE